LHTHTDISDVLYLRKRVIREIHRERERAREKEGERERKREREREREGGTFSCTPTQIFLMFFTCARE